MPFRIEQSGFFCMVSDVTFFPHAPLGVLGALSPDPSLSTVDWVAVLMLGLFLGILLVSGAFYLMTRKQILDIKREKAMSRPPLEELIPSSLDLPEQWLAIRSGEPHQHAAAIGPLVRA